ncbi:hypothetical protein [Micromonospora zhanjiangensis]|uniref:Uncharacterized protein n=1 Tax=Micromonospora zhanjiangensis TaxID=1522057 RepID=A0ABV8KXW8_9ACTN
MFFYWFSWFIWASTVPVFVLVVVGAVLAPLRSRLGPLGIGLVVGAVASPLLWTVGASIHRNI